MDLALHQASRKAPRRSRPTGRRRSNGRAPRPVPCS